VIESTIPEINVAELMERVRAEALRPKKLPPKESAVTLPPVAMLPAAPAVWIPGPVKSRKTRLDLLLETARAKNEPRSRMPKFLRRFFRKQGGYNRALLESVAVLAKTNEELTRRVADITACLGQFNGWLLALHEQSDADATWMKAAAPGLSALAALKGELESRRAASHELETRQTQLAEQVTAIETMAQKRTAALQASLEQIQGELGGVARAASLEGLRNDFDRAGIHLRNLQAHADAISQQLVEIQGRYRETTDKQAAEIEATRRAMEEPLGALGVLDQRIASLEEGTIADAALMKGELAEHSALFRRLLGGDLDQPVHPEKKRGAAIKAPLGMDSFYVAFENRFRGSRAEIKKRVAFYLPFLRKCHAGTSGRPVLDVGCGRGEWLELLREEELDGRGVDLNAAMVSQCKARRLKVQRRDALDYLRAQRTNSHGAITGFHIIEHLPFETLLELFREARRVLKPGGVAIFESPNCKNLVVGACNFHIDPTHHHPVFPETAELMLAAQGFEKIKIEYLSPVADARFNANTSELATLKDLLFGPQDFGIIAYKPGNR
jgi:SAM-dependent methyltransferase